MQQQEEQPDDDLMIPLNVQSRLGSFIDRYFVKTYQDNQYVFQHSNRLYLCGISNNHPIVTSQFNIKEIEYLQKEQQVRGKKKKGGLKAKADTQLLKVKMENDEEYFIKAGQDGYIIEMNENIQKDIQCLKQHPESLGFVCIIQCGRK